MLITKFGHDNLDGAGW